MAHFSRIEDRIVVQVIVVNNDSLNNLEFPESELAGQEFIASIGLSGTWLQTSYNNNFRDKFAGIGDIYDEVNDVFVSPVVREAPVVEEVINDNN
jgi:hypothetical protein